MIALAVAAVVVFLAATWAICRAAWNDPADLDMAIADALQCGDCFFQITEPGHSIYIACPRHDLGPVNQ